jgi:hypothetical protein
MIVFDLAGNVATDAAQISLRLVQRLAFEPAGKSVALIHDERANVQAKIS